MAISLSFLPTRWFWQHVFYIIAPEKYQIKTKLNSCNKIIFSIFEDLKTMLHAFL